MREQLLRAAHQLNRLNDLLRQLDFLTKFEVVFKLKLNLIVGTSNAPTHPTQDLIERLNRESGPKVTSRDKHITSLLKQFSICIVLDPRKHLYII